MRKPCSCADDPLHFQCRICEIQQKTVFSSRRAQLRFYNRKMNVLKCLYRFQIYNHFIFHDQIETMFSDFNTIK